MILLVRSSSPLTGKRTFTGDDVDWFHWIGIWGRASF